MFNVVKPYFHFSTVWKKTKKIKIIKKLSTYPHCHPHTVCDNGQRLISNKKI